MSITLVLTIMIIAVVEPMVMITKGSTQNYILDLNKAYADLMEQMVNEKEKDGIATDALELLLGNVGITNVESSYAYLVDDKGMMLYHPKKEKIGKNVENDVVKQLVNKIEKGEEINRDVISYYYKGEIKYASYSIIKPVNWLLIVTADEKEILGETSHVIKRTIIQFSIVGLLISLIGYIVIRKLLLPLQETVTYIQCLGELDFSKNMLSEKKNSCKGEVGVINQAIENMAINMKQLYSKLSAVTYSISDSEKKLTEVIDSVSDASKNNSVVTQELVVSMEETVGTTDYMVKSIKKVSEEIKEISEQSRKSSTLSENIKNKAEEFEVRNQKSITNIKELYNDIKAQVDHTLARLEAIKRINEMVNSITNVSRQTSLLALNASIEAARAGEAGKGFGVVAGEIGTLAAQSSRMTEDITVLVEEIMGTVNEMQESLTKTLEFFDKDIIITFNETGQYIKGYSIDSVEICNSNEMINGNIKTLNDDMYEMVEHIDTIKKIIEKSTDRIGQVAQKTSDVVNIMKDTQHIVETNHDNVKMLESEMSKIKL